ncbi:MAG TPA: hydrolase [Candidatus Brocadiia bacterium]|nr:hydrolase [Candidatus Brocadiia bacterium]
MLQIENTALVVIDIQGKLAQLAHEKETLFENTRKLIAGLKILGVPIIWTEQLPDKLGRTIPEIAEALSGCVAIPKASFSCCGEPLFAQTLESLGRRQILLSGIEAHVCVYQTAVDLLKRGCEVHVVADCVSSRTKSSRDIGIEMMRDEGVKLKSMEAALFELMRVAEGESFRQVVKAIK